MDLPFWITHADAPLPRWSAIIFVSSVGFPGPVSYMQVALAVNGYTLLR